MALSNRVKEVAIDIVSRVSQVVFAGLIVSPFLTAKSNPGIVMAGLISFFLCLIVALVIASTIKEDGV